MLERWILRWLPARRTAPRAVAEELEPRILYSADLMPALAPGPDVPATGPPVVRLVASTDAAVPAQVGRIELVVVDAGVPDAQRLVDAIAAQRPDASLRIVQLDAARDGLAQVGDALAALHDVAAVHLLTHGEAGAFELAGARIDAAAVDARGAAFEAWRPSLAAGADLLLYGCDLASTEAGLALMARLAERTGADVAASDDPTGSAALGGDWDLEVELGAVQAQALSAPAAAGWTHLLEFGPRGDETLVNTEGRAGTQSTTIGGGSVAMDRNGRSVVVWSDDATGDVRLRRFDAAGVAQGAETVVNTTTAGTQSQARVAMAADGRFVVVWTSAGQDGDLDGVYAQRYDAAGVAQGGEFRVNTTTEGDQGAPAVAMDATGRFVVAWTDALADGSDGGVSAQRYDAAGVAQGGEFRVNTTTFLSQSDPSVAMNAGGSFVVAWHGSRSGNMAVYFQRYDASGAAQGAETLVDAALTGSWRASAGLADDGRIVVAWETLGGADDEQTGIRARRFDASGAELGSAFRVNTWTAERQTNPTLAMTGNGEFVVAWQSSNQDGGGEGVYAQHFSASGTATGGEFRLATTTTGEQERPSVALSGSRAVAVWSGNGAVSDPTGVYMQRLQGGAPANTVPGAQTILDGIPLVFSAANGNALVVSDRDAGADPVEVTLSVTRGTLTLGGTAGLTFIAGDGTGDASMTLRGTVSAVNAALNGLTYVPAAIPTGPDTLMLTTRDAALVRLEIDTNLQARYTFDGNADDVAPGPAQNGVLLGNAGFVTDATRGRVLSLDGAGDAVQVAGLFSNPASVTLAAWVNASGAGNREVISLGNSVALRIGSANVVQAFVYDSVAADWQRISSVAVLDAGWNHVAMTFDDASRTLTVYLNGTVVGTLVTAEPVSYTLSTGTFIGRHGNGISTADFSGLIDDARIYGRALTADEIRALARDTALADTDPVAITVAPDDLYLVPGLAAPSLVGVYTFSAPDDLGRDGAGNSAPMTLYGSPSQTPGPGGGGALALAGGASGQYGDLGGITTGGPMTLAADVRFDSTGFWQRIVDFGQANSTGLTAIFLSRIDVSNDLAFSIERELAPGVYSTVRAVAPGAITNGVWMHVAATVDAAGMMRLYVNGTLAQAVPGFVPEVGVRLNNFVGRSNWAVDAPFHGAIDNLVVANGAISAADVARLHQQGNAFDVAENAANGTVLGTLVVSDPDSGDTHAFDLGGGAGGRFAVSADGTLTVADGTLLDHESATGHTFTARATDQNAAWRGESLTVSVTNVVEAPVITSNGGGATAAVGVTEGSVAVTTVVATPDVTAGATLAYSIDPGADGARFAIGATGALTFVLAPDAESPADADLDNVYVVTVRVTDSASRTDTQTLSVTVNGVNEAPAFTALDGAPTFVEGGAAVVLDGNVTVADAELTRANAFGGATLTLARSGGANAQDVLGFDGVNVTTAGANVLVGGVQVGTFAFAGGQLVVSFGVNATQARVNTLLQNIVYANGSDAPPASVTIGWTLSDGNAGAQGSGGALTATGATTVTLTAVNDAPVFGTGGTGTRTIDVAGGWDRANVTLVQADGRILLAGMATVSGLPAAVVTRLLASGELDTGFGTGGHVLLGFGAGTDVSIMGLAQQADGRILATGWSDHSGQYDLLLARLNTDGTPDGSFGTGGRVLFDRAGVHDFGDAVAVQADGRIVVAGSTGADPTLDQLLVRFNADGSLDTGFGSGGSVVTAIGSGRDIAYALAIRPDGRIVTGGYAFMGATGTDATVARYLSDGTLDTSFGTGGITLTDLNSGDDLVAALQLQADGRILLTGQTLGAVNAAFVLRYLEDGTPDAGFGTGGAVVLPVGAGSSDAAADLAVQADGRILVSGSTETGGLSDVMVTRLLPDGTVDASYGAAGRTVVSVVPGSDAAGRASLQADGRLVVAGWANAGGGTRDLMALRLDSRGLLDPSFGVTQGVAGEIAYTEGGAPVVLDADAAVFDRELSAADAFGGATLTLARSGGANAQDVLGFDGVNVTTAGANVLVGGVQVGTFAFAGGQLVVSFGVNATQARVNTLLQNIVYANGSDAPPASVTIGWTFSDGNAGAQGSGGALTATGATTVIIAAVNDAPVNVAPTGAYTPLDTALTFGTAAGRPLSVSDADSGPLTVTLSATNGALLTLSGTAGLGFAQGDGTADATMTFSGTAAAINVALEGLALVPAAGFRGLSVLTLATDDGAGGTDTDVVRVHVGAIVVTNASDAVNGTVTSVAALAQADGGDGVSLREALLAANATAGPPGEPLRVLFAIPGAGVHTIALGAELPALTRPVVLDASGDDSWLALGGRPAVVLDGQNLVQDGLRLFAGSDGSTVRGFVIQRFTGDGIDVTLSGAHTIAGNWIGLDANGGIAAGNLNGVSLRNANDVTIGGVSAADRNVISGNQQTGLLIRGIAATGNVVIGNWIGLDATGALDLDGQTVDVPGRDGILIAGGASGNRIGTDADGTNDAAERNVISGNNWVGVNIVDAGTVSNRVQGNWIGTDATGLIDVGNRVGVSLFQGAVDNRIGSGAPGAGNVIAGSTNMNVFVGHGASGNRVQGNLIGLAADGVTALGNGGAGVVLSDGGFAAALSGNVIGTDGDGTDDAAEGNTISANTTGVRLNGPQVTATVVAGNRIGTDASGTLARGNLGAGVSIEGGASGNRVGGLVPAQGNLIAHNGSAGVVVTGASGSNALLGNAIHDNAGLGIDLGGDGVTANDAGDADAGANALLNAPAVGTVVQAGGTLRVTGSYAGAPNTFLRIELFANPTSEPSGTGEGRTWLGALNVATDAGGAAAWSVDLATVLATGSFVTGTATRTDATYTTPFETSEFSNHVRVDAQPVVGIAATPLAYVENDGARVIDAALTVADADSTTLAGATVRITANHVPGQDVLAFVDQAGITGSWDAASGTLTLSGTASVAQYQAALRTVTYTNTSDSPATAARTVSFTVNDGTSASAAATRTVTVAAVDDAPAIGAVEGAALAYIENQAATVVTSTLTLSDADSATLAGATVRITANHAPGEDVLAFVDQAGITGSWDAAGGTLTLSGTASVAQYEAALRTVTYTNTSDNPATAARTVSFTVNDGTSSSTAATRTVTVAAVNDAPTLTGAASVSVLENLTPVTLVTSTDLDGGTPVYGIVGGADAARFSIDAATGALRFVAAPDFEAPTDADGDNVYDVTVRVADGAGGTATQALSVTVTNANEAPVNAVPGPRTATEDSPLAITGVSAGDVDGNLATVRLGVTRGTLAVDLAGGATVSAGANGSATLTLAGTQAEIDAALATLTYQGNANLNGADTLTVTSTDALGATDTDTVAITVTPVDDAPVISGVAATALAYFENQPARGIALALTLSDPDSTTIAGATVRITVNYAPGEDVLGFVDRPGISGSWDAASGTLTLTGTASVAQYQAALRTVTYANTSDSPSTAARTVSLTATDGTSSSAAATRTVTVTPINDAPVVTVAAPPLAFVENEGARVIDAALTVADVDSAMLAGATVRIATNYAADQDVLGFVRQGTITGRWDVVSGTLTLTGAATVAQYEAALRTVTYANTSDRPSLLQRDVQFAVRDGPATSAVSTATVTVADVNDAPVLVLDGTNLVVDGSFEAGGTGWTTNSVLEPSTLVDPYRVPPPPDGTTFVEVEGWTPTEPDPAWIEQTIATEAGRTYVTRLWTVTRNERTGGDLGAVSADGVEIGRFSADAIWSERTFEFTATSASTTIRITSLGSVSGWTLPGDGAGLLVDDVRVVARDAAAAWTEGGAPVALAPGAQAFDPELTPAGTFAGATLTLERQGGADAQDLFSAVGTLGALAQGGALTVGGATVGTVVHNGGGRLVLAFDAAAGGAQVNEVLRGIAYANASEAPPASATIAWTFDDGNAGAQGAGGPRQVAGTTVVSIAAVDDAPVVTVAATPLAYVENEGARVIDAALTVADVDSATLAGATVRIAANHSVGADVLGFVDQAGISGSWDAASGTLTLSGTASVAQYQAALRTVTYANTSDNPAVAPRTIAFAVDDGTAFGAPATRVVAFGATNDAPVTADATAAGAEDAVAIPVSLAGADIDGSVAAFVLSGLPAHGTLYLDAALTSAAQAGTAYAATGNALTLWFAPAADWHGTTTFQYAARDDAGLQDATPAIATVTVAPVNDAPSIAFGTGPATFVENDAPVALDALATVADADAADFAGGTLTVSIAAGADAGDRLSIADQGGGPGQVSVTGNALRVGGVLVGSFAGGVGTTPLVVSFTAAADASHVQAILRALRFESVGDAPSAAPRTVTVVLADGDGGLSPTLAKTVAVIALDDPATLVRNSGVAASERGTVVLDAARLAFADPDTPAAAIVLRLQAAPVAGELRLGATVLRAGDAFTQADLDAGRVTYTHLAAGVFADGFSVVADDGSGTPIGPVTVAISIDAVNDAPRVVAVPAVATNEDVPVVFSDARGTRLVVLDDADASAVVELRLSVDGGARLTLSRVDGLAFLDGDGDADAAITVRGTLGDVNRALDGLRLSPAPDASGRAWLTIVVDDLGASGAGGPLAATARVAVDVAPVDDAPTLSMPAAVSTGEDTPLAFDAASGRRIVIADVDTTGPMRLTLAVDAGTLSVATLDGLAVRAGTPEGASVLVLEGVRDALQAALDGLRLAPAPDWYGTTVLDVVIEDGAGGAAQGRTTVTVLPVDDAPTLSAPQGVTLRTGEEVVVADRASAIVAADVDAGGGPIVVELRATVGRLALGASGGLTVETVADGAAEGPWMRLTGTMDSINASLATLRFQAGDGWWGTATLEVSVASGGRAPVVKSIDLQVLPAPVVTGGGFGTTGTVPGAVLGAVPGAGTGTDAGGGAARASGTPASGDGGASGRAGASSGEAQADAAAARVDQDGGTRAGNTLALRALLGTAATSRGRVLVPSVVPDVVTRLGAAGEPAAQRAAAEYAREVLRREQAGRPGELTGGFALVAISADSIALALPVDTGGTARAPIDAALDPSGALGEPTGGAEEDGPVLTLREGAEIAGVALTAGAVWWAIYGGATLWLLLAVGPLARTFDPLPVLARERADGQPRDEADAMFEDHDDVLGEPVASGRPPVAVGMPA